MVGIVLVFNSCLQDTLLFPVEPRISNASMRVVKNPGTAQAWTLTISFDYEDGDGDIGGNAKDGIESDSSNLILVDNRTLPVGFTWPVVVDCSDTVSSIGLRDTVCQGSEAIGRVPVEVVFDTVVSYEKAELLAQLSYFVLPNLSIDSRVPSISGRVTFTINNVRILPYQSPATTQDLSYDIRIRDVKGHWSNTITVTGRLN